MGYISVMRILVLALMFLSTNALAQTPKIVRSEKADFTIRTIAENLEHPWSVAFLPLGGYLVTEREGKLWHITDDGTKEEVAGLPKIYAAGQAGLFDVITGPDFKAESGYIYWAYAAGDSSANNTEVARGKYDTRTNKLSDIKVIFKAMPKVEGDNHYGGRLAFANDGSLYITLGERFDYRDEAQNLKSDLGKVVRIMPDGTMPLSGSPFLHKLGADKEIFTYGHRNAQGIALNPYSGKMWIHEHGPRGGDEINVLASGKNYGWPLTSYGVNYTGTKVSDEQTREGVTPPILHWTPSIAPSGMTFYTGRAFPGWRGNLFVGALAGTHLRRVVLNGEKVDGQEELLGDLGARIRDVRTGPDGGLYLLTDDSEGKLLKLEPIQAPTVSGETREEKTK